MLCRVLEEGTKASVWVIQKQIQIEFSWTSETFAVVFGTTKYRKWEPRVKLGINLPATEMVDNLQVPL